MPLNGTKPLLKAEVSISVRPLRSNDQRMSDPSEDEILAVLKTMNKFSEKDHLNCGACGYDTCRNHSVAIIKGLAETEMCLPYH
jgi:ArsR family metal-binding transcriptional regulator